MGKGRGGVIPMVHNAFQEASNLTPQSDTQIREKKKKKKRGFDDGHISWVHVWILKPLSLACCDIKKCERRFSCCALFYKASSTRDCISLGHHPLKFY